MTCAVRSGHWLYLGMSDCKEIDVNAVEIVFVHFPRGHQRTGPHVSSFWDGTRFLPSV